MGFEGEVWHVRGGDEPVGEILIDDADFPWLSGRFTPGPGYATVRDLFARELALLRAEIGRGVCACRGCGLERLLNDR